MILAEANVFASPTLPSIVGTSVDAQSAVSRNDSRRRWQELIDYQLIEWGRERNQLEDEGVESPSGPTIQRAIEWAQTLRDADCPAPDRVVPDPNGGIVFEHRAKAVTEVLHVWEDGSVEYCCFRGTRLEERRTL